MNTDSEIYAEQYHDIAKTYNKAATFILHENLYIPTLLKHIAPLQVNDAIDLACGTGIYTRLLRERVPGKVVGSDICQDMLDIATKESSGLDITYIQVDMCQAPAEELLNSSDLVTAFFLLNYASSKEKLNCMCANIY